MVANFWSGNEDKVNKIHWKKWEDISEVKGKRALGFRDIQCFNTALLAKQFWRILTNPNLLVSKVIKGKYFPNSSILEAKTKRRASWIWQSLQSSIEILESGLRKRDGKTISIWKDRWLKCSKTDRVTSPKPQLYNWEKVSKLIQGHRWNYKDIVATFSWEEARQIMDIPLSMFRRQIKLIWTGTNHGEYSTKTRYIRAKEMLDVKNKQR